MALAADIANKSIREAISTIANKVDELSASPLQDVSSLTQAIEALKVQVQALNVAINGEPAAPVGEQELPAPTVPV